MATNNNHNRQADIPLAGFEPAILASERPQTDALNREATGISGVSFVGYVKIIWGASAGIYCAFKWCNLNTGTVS